MGLIADRTVLAGHKGYDGGLDCDTSQTGTHSYYVEFSNCPIMFHVSTELPHDPIDEQQIQKKRHIGNDVVCVVFKDQASPPISPRFLRTTFMHYLMAVCPVEKDGALMYKVSRAQG